MKIKHWIVSVCVGGAFQRADLPLNTNVAREFRQGGKCSRFLERVLCYAGRLLPPLNHYQMVFIARPEIKSIRVGGRLG